MHMILAGLGLVVALLFVWVETLRRRVRDVEGAVAATSTKVTQMEAAAATRPAPAPCRRMHVADLPATWRRMSAAPELADEDEVNPVLRRR